MEDSGVLKVYEVVVVGGGQSGLAAGYFLQKKNIPFIILDAGSRTGDSWRHRYDSLVLFTPRSYDALPGMEFPGAAGGYPTKDEVADYLEAYAKKCALPVRFGSPVMKIEKKDTLFALTIDNAAHEVVMAKKVVLAVGSFQQPVIPGLAGRTTSMLFQIHSSEYKNPAQIPQGKVLVVGGGNSAAHIAAELLKTHFVDISIRSPLRYASLTLFGKSMIWWLDIFGKLHVPSTPARIQKANTESAVIFGHELKKLLKVGQIVMRPPVAKIMGAEVHFEDGTAERYSGIVWATGFKQNLSWVDIPHFRDSHGDVFHKEGVSAIPGIYFVGLEWQRTRSSSLICGAVRDAEYIVGQIVKK